MKKLILSFIIVALIGITCISSYAQNYKSAVGVRLGYPLALSFKQFINEDGAVELTFGARFLSNVGVAYSITGAYQMHNTIESINGLRWYYGFGGGFHTYKYKAAYTALGDYIGKNSISIFGQLGLDYKFEDKPIDVSLDWSPTFYFGSTTYLHGYSSSAGGLSLRYVIN